MSDQSIEKALEDLRNGSFCLIFDHDERERETDMVIASQFVRPASIRRLRKDGGGLICVTVPFSFYDKVEMPYLTDLYEASGQRYKLLKALVANDIPYDAKSAFSLTINHRRTFTGITDKDRALTINEFARILDAPKDTSSEELIKIFGENFRTPGHVPLLNTSENILSEREGHTELSTAMMIMAGLTPSATICEMMGDNDIARPKEKARIYADDNGFVFLSGAQVIEAWRAWKER